MEERVFAVIPSWNLKDDLIACVASVLESSSDQVRVVVVDSASTDGTVEAVQQAFGNAVEIICCQENRGFAYAANKGCRYALEAGADFALVLNNDTILGDRMIQELTQTMSQHPGVGIAAPVIYYYDSPDRIWHTGDRHLIGPPLTWHVSKSEVSSAPFKVDYVTGCGMLIRREVLETVGMFSEDYHMYFEDADFCQRARSAGFEIMVVPSAILRHKVSLSTRGAAPERIFYQTRGRVIFLNRHSPHFLWLAAHVYLWMRALAGCTRRMLEGRPDLSRSIVAGTIAGYAYLLQPAERE